MRNPEILPYNNREGLKRRGWEAVHNKALPCYARAEGALRVIRAWHERSRAAAQSDGWLCEHPSFQVYAAATLRDPVFPAEVQLALRRRFKDISAKNICLDPGAGIWRPKRRRRNL